MMKRYAWWLALVLMFAVVMAVTGATSARSVDMKEGTMLAGGASRDVAATVWFQGFLADVDTGDPINATYTVLARIFAVPSGGGALWGPETHNGVTVTEGWFNIELGANIGGLPAFDSPPYYVELIVAGETLQPRLKLASVPSALHAGGSDDGTQWYATADGIAYADTVSIGTSYTQELFTLMPTSWGDDAFMHFRPRILLDGEKDGSRIGEGTVIGLLDSDPNFYVVNAEEDGWLFCGAGDFPNAAFTDSAKLVVSPYAYMWGWEPPGALTVDVGSVGDYGAAVYSAQSYSGAHTIHADYYGNEMYATAVYGDATGGDQWTTGGEFRGNAYGVEGYAVGDWSGGALYGVYGDCDNGAGSSSCYSIYGSQPSGAGALYAGYFSGDTHVSGTLTKAAGSFKIDHPLDPANMYLSHSFVESPDMMNVYNGNAVLDGAGEATVLLPDYFDALNRDFRYQLTPIGAPGPNLHIATEIAGNSFRIAGGEPGMKVSWMVTGIREDRYAEEHPIVVEELKTGYEQGRYMHPIENGQPEELGLTYEEEHNAEKAAIRAKHEGISAAQAASRAQARGASQTDWRNK